MTTPAFRKGQPVTLFYNWDSKGTVYVVELIVYSCGAKQMVLVDEAGRKFEGRNFLPTEKQYHSGVVKPRMSREEAEAFALQHGALIVQEEREHMEGCIAHYGRPESDGYTQSMRKNIALLHEPRVKWG